MVPPSSTRKRSSRRQKGRRSPSAMARIGRIWRGWWVEIVVACLILLAVFLLVEQMNIRQTFSSWLRAALTRLETLTVDFGQSVVRFVGDTSLSDLVAYLLLIAVAVLIGWRTRYRFLTNPRLSEIRCPRCGGGLHRIHRRWRHRVLSLILPVRRYRCTDRACSWQGLRIRRTDYR